MIEFAISSEHGHLTDVVLATIGNFRISAPINVTQAHYYQTDPPRIEVMLREQAAFAQVLESRGVTVHWAEAQEESPLQVFTRDVATVIRDTLVIGRMGREIRHYEPAALARIIEQCTGRVLYVPEDATLEGGDVLIDGDTLYVGLGERTNEQGVAFLRKSFPGLEVISFRLKPGILHLDVVFNILAGGVCVVHPEAFADGVDEAFFRARFAHVVTVSEQEQFDLATNLFSISPHTVLSDVSNTRVNTALRGLGFEMVELDFAHTRRVGGSLRCATLPLRRLE